MKRQYTLEGLGSIMDQLLGEKGCPWDKEQTHESLKRYLIEESYEVVEAIDDQDDMALVEELGDVLLQVVFHAKLAEKRGAFTLEQVIAGIEEKLVRRHPHVFAQTQADTAQEVLVNWEAIKALEKTKVYESILDKVPQNLPSLQEALKLQEKAAGVGFDWDTLEEVRLKMAEEELELEEAIRSGEQNAIYEEFGDVLFSLVNMARFLDVVPEEALFRTNTKFRRRFRYVEEKIQEKSLELTKKNVKIMENLWKESKKTV